MKKWEAHPDSFAQLALKRVVWIEVRTSEVPVIHYRQYTACRLATPALVPIPQMNEIADLSGGDALGRALEQIFPTPFAVSPSSPPRSALCGSGDVIARFHVYGGFYPKK
jgi:hypothetical protein